MKKVIVSLLACGIVFGGCGIGGGIGTLPGGNPISDKIAEDAGEKIAEEMLGGGVDLEYAEEGSGDVVAWPKQMPSDVPEFKYAEIEGSMAAPTTGNEDNSVVVSFRNVQEGAYAKYEQDLKNAGWEITTDPSWTDEHISAEKGDFTIDVDVNYNGDNTAALYLMEYNRTAE